jgi:hypothetical protein
MKFFAKVGSPRRGDRTDIPAGCPYHATDGSASRPYQIVFMSHLFRVFVP